MGVLMMELSTAGLCHIHNCDLRISRNCFVTTFTNRRFCWQMLEFSQTNTRLLFSMVWCMVCVHLVWFDVTMYICDEFVFTVDLQPVL